MYYISYSLDFSLSTSESESTFPFFSLGYLISKSVDACAFCGLITNSAQDMENHKRDCNTQFRAVRKKICRYFAKGGCLKGNECIFSHPSEKQVESAPVCRNGLECRYLANGVCKFYHRQKWFQRAHHKETQHRNNKHVEQRFQCDSCDSVFISKDNLNEHVKSRHVQKRYKCDSCAAVFISNEGLRNHVERKHRSRREEACEFCGLIANSVQEMANHKRDCNTQFQPVRNKECKYFINGGCFKGNGCIFSHPEEKQVKSASVCRNGLECRFLFNGVCKFYHRERGFQKAHNKETQYRKNFSNGYFQTRRYEEDFPKLQQTNNAPIGRKNRVI